MSDSFTLGKAEEREGGTWVPIPDGSILAAEVVTAKKVKKPYVSQETGEPVYRVEWTFKVTEDGPFSGRAVKGETSIAFVPHPGCRMYSWVRELMGMDDLPGDFVFDTDVVEGLPCRVQMKSEEKPRKDGEGIWVNNTVKDVLRSENKPVAAGTVYGAYDSEEPF